MSSASTVFILVHGGRRNRPARDRVAPVYETGGCAARSGKLASIRARSPGDTARAVAAGAGT